MSSLRRLRRRTLVVVVVAAVAALLTALPAQAASMTVAPNEVVVVGNGACSLREAIENANGDAQTHDDCPAGSGADTIFLLPVVYDLGVAVDRGEQTGLPAITSEVEVRPIMVGDPAILDGALAVRHFRVTSAGTLHLLSLTLRNGQSDGGGAIANQGQVSLDAVTLDGNAADVGGALSNVGGEVTLTGGTVSDNTASGTGGGIYSLDGNVELSGTRLRDNWAQHGGGFANFGTATVTHTWVSDNSADFGGGILNAGTLAIRSSTLSGNSAVNGGAVDNQSGGLALTNVTVSGNDAGFRGGGIKNDSDLTLTNSTVMGNAAPEGGGVYLGALDELVRNTIVAGSEGANCAGPLPSTPSPGATNLDDDGTCGPFVQDFTTVANAFLGPLGFHSGATPVHVAQPWSVAVDAGDQTTCDAIAPNVDQRGQPRTLGGRCDIGSVEVFSFEMTMLIEFEVSRLPLDDGFKRSLLAHLGAAREALEHGDVEAAVGELDAFANHVSTKRGKAIVEDDADRLLAGAAKTQEVAGATPSGR
jgi:hypothetical protein